MAEIFAGLVEGLSKVIGGFDNKELAFGIALAILAMAVMIGVFLHLRRHRPWIQPVRRLSAKLKKLRGSDLDADERLIEADHAFESEAHLAPLWQEYRKHLQSNPQVPGYLNLVDPRLWFSVESLPGRGYEHWCATWAGIFLTVGLLFTFIGLSAALLKVGDISGADSQTMKDAITGILKVSSAKFITSIAGLIAYIGFSLVTSRYHSSQQAAVKELVDAVQHLSVPLTPELLLYEQNHTARKQLTRMERLTDDLAVAIDSKLEQRLKILAADFGRHVDVIRQDSALADVLTEIKNVLTEIKNGMGGMSQEFGSEIKEAAASLAQAAKAMGQGFQVQSAELDQKIGEFGGKLKSITGTLDQIPNNISRALNETMKQLTDAIADLSRQLAQGGQAGGDALRQGGQQAGEELGNASSQFTRLFTQATGELVKQFAVAQTGLQATIQDLASRLQTVESSLKALPNAVAAQVEHLNAAGESFKSAGQTVTGASGALRQAAEPLTQTAATLRTSVDQIREAVAQAATIHRQASESSQSALAGLKSAADAAERVFRTHVDRFGRVDDELAKALEVLRHGVEQVSRTTQDIFKEYDSHITKAVNGLASVAENLGEAAEEIGDELKQLAEAKQSPRR